MGRLKVSIILQGLWDSNCTSRILSFCSYTDDIIFVTWSGQSGYGAEELRSQGITVIEIDDPGSIVSYEQSGTAKYFNVNRRVVSYRHGLMKAKYDNCVISRLDIEFDLEAFLSEYLRSEREIGVTNVNSLNPYRLFGEKRFLSFCDWLIIASKETLLRAYINDIDEESLLSEKTHDTFSATYFGKVNSEQVFSAILLNKLDEVLDKSGELESYHKEFLAKCCIIDWQKIGLKSQKYRRFTYSWVSYYHPRSEHDYQAIPIQRLRFLPLYLFAKCLELIR